MIIDRNRERQPHRPPAVPVGASQLPPDNMPGADATLTCRRQELLARAVQELPARCREVFLLRKVEHLRVEEVSLRLGISNNLIENHLRKALLHCQSRLADRGDTWYASAERLFSSADPSRPSEATCRPRSPRVSGAKSVREHAAVWALRVDAGDCSDMEWRELERWLSADSRRLTVFEDARGLWGELDEVAHDVTSRAAAQSDSRTARGVALRLIKAVLGAREDRRVRPRRWRFCWAEIFAIVDKCFR